MYIFEHTSRHSLHDRGVLILTIVIPTIVMTVMFGLGMIMITGREEIPVVMVGLWPLYGVGPLHFMFIQ